MADPRHMTTRKEWLLFVYGSTHRTAPAAAEAALIEVVSILAKEAAVDTVRPDEIRPQA